MSTNILSFVLISQCLVVVFITIYVFAIEGKRHNWIGAAFICSALSMFVYSAEFFVDNRTIVHILNCFFSMLIDIIIVDVGILDYRIIRFKKSKALNSFVKMGIFFGVADALAMAQNIFTSNYFETQKCDEGVINYCIHGKFMYGMHIFYVVFSIAVLVIFMSFHIAKTSEIYKRLCIDSVVVSIICAVYSVFIHMLLKDTHVNPFPFIAGITSFFYFLIIFVSFRYRKKLTYKDAVFDEMVNPIISFDKNGIFMFYNKKAKHLIRLANPDFKIGKNVRVTASDVAKALHFKIDEEDLNEEQFFHWEYKSGKNYFENRIYYRIIKDDNDDAICSYFLFGDKEEDIDDVTGFNKWDSLKKYVSNKDNFKYPSGVVVLDISRLSVINDTYGRKEGDMLVQIVANAMVKFCPYGTYFAKSRESYLVAICNDVSYSELSDIVEFVKAYVYTKANVEYKLHLQSAIVGIKSYAQDPLDCIKSAFLSLSKKKMLDEYSKHTSIIDSLIQMQREADPAYDGHVKRTKSYCSFLGKRLGLDDIQQSNLELLCLIVEIGKIGIPYEIVNKTGLYTVDEWNLMKSHVEKGYRIAAASEEFSDVAQCVKYHHENYDGSGYPDGLSGESIPYLSRIIAVVEAYDAMTSDRAYRKAYSSLRAREELLNYAGKQFDPSIVEEFIKVLEEIAPIDYEQEMINKKLIEKEAASFKPMSAKKFDVKENNVKNVVYTNYLVDGDDYIIDIDDMFTALTGYKNEDVKNLKLKQHDLIFSEDLAEYDSQCRASLRRCNEAYIRHRIKCKDGSEKTVFCYGRLVFENNNIVYSKITVTDITNSSEKEKNAQGIKNETNVGVIDYERDSLTGSLTYKAFESISKNLIQSSDSDYIYMLVDIDDFKKYNNVNGKEKGDEVIKYFAECINKLIDKRGIVGRAAADRFAVMCSMQRGTLPAVQKSEISELWGLIMDLFKDKNTNLSVSIGACFLRNGMDSFDQTFEKSLEALMKAKDNGKKCYVLYE